MLQLQRRCSPTQQCLDLFASFSPAPTSAPPQPHEAALNCVTTKNTKLNSCRHLPNCVTHFPTPQRDKLH